MSYHFLSKLTHWSSALIILGLLLLGIYMTSLDFSDFKLQLYMLHKSFGLLVLGLLFVRILSFLFFKRPKAIEAHKPWERFLSRAVHIFLYGGLLLMPISGWVMSSAGDYTVQFFGLHMPDVVTKNEFLFENSKEAHEILAYILIVIIGVHVAGALKHHFIDRDETLKRMTSKAFGFKGGVVLVAVLAVWSLFLVALLVSGFRYSVEIERALQVQENVPDETAFVVSDIQGWVIDLSQSTMVFSASQYGQGFKGQFEEFGGQIFFDPDRLDESRVRIEVDIQSLRTGSADRDAQALAPDWFNASVYPKAVFEADQFERVNDRAFVADGVLRVRDVALPFTLPFNLDFIDDAAFMRSEFSINRLDYEFGKGQNEGAVGNKVEFFVEVRALRH